MNACYCDYDLPQAVWETRPIARKEHKCTECGGKIKPGERYERVRGIWDIRHPETYKTCVYCLAIRDLVESKVDCFCWCYTQMLNEVQEQINDDIPGLRFEVGRIVVERNRSREAQK